MKDIARAGGRTVRGMVKARRERLAIARAPTYKLEKGSRTMLDGVLESENDGIGLDRLGSSGVRAINLDANANVSATPAVIAAVNAALTGLTNPSSDHAGGSRARTMLAQARDDVVSLATGVYDDGIVFTSGCTEANNTVLNIVRVGGLALITTMVEHPSVLAPAAALAREGFQVIHLAVGADGAVDPEHVRKTLAEIRGGVLLSVQTANSETGVVQPMAEIAELALARGNVLLHTDAAQSFGKLPLELHPERGPHVASVSAHKLHGPMGVGAMLLADGEDRVPALLHGGDQEKGRRAGTEPVALIAGMGAACAERSRHLDEHVAAMRILRDRLEHGILNAIEGAAINGGAATRLPNTTSIRLPRADAMAVLARLDAAGVLASQGSACSSMRPTPSHVLTAMGLSEEQAFSTIRLSTSPLNTTEEIDVAIATIVQAVSATGIKS